MKLRSAAFSLPELLIVISIMGIITGIAIPMMHYFQTNAAKNRAKRNAQNLATTYSAGLAVGHDFGEGESETSDVVNKVVTGTTVSVGGFTHYIGLPNLPQPQRDEALTHLEIKAGRLVYMPSSEDD